MTRTRENATNFVESFVELFQLRRLGHDGFVHEEGRLNLLESTFLEEIETVIDHSLIEVDSISREKETTMSGNLGS